MTILDDVVSLGGSPNDQLAMEVARADIPGAENVPMPGEATFTAEVTVLWFVTVTANGASLGCIGLVLIFDDHATGPELVAKVSAVDAECPLDPFGGFR